jgi:hypothetical protein
VNGHPHERIIADPLVDRYAYPSVPMRKTFRLELGVEGQVLKLARFGLSVAEISKRTELGTRIIEHILNSPTANGALVLSPLPPKRVE